jgi:uncharacterized protein (DUF952 family)
VSTGPVLHLAEVAHWEEAARTGAYRWSTLGRTLEEEGFIHCSTPEQVPGVLARYYTSYPDDLVLLTVDPERLASPLRWDVVNTLTGERFPHVYGPITPDAVTHTQVLHPPHGAQAHRFDQSYWDEHYEKAGATAAGGLLLPPNPYLVQEVTDLAPGTALEAGCGEGAEAIWLARAGWQVTAVDIAAEPLARAADRAADEGVGDRVEWVRADLSSWEAGRTFDLVTTHYAHPAIPQLEFYDRLSAWVAPGGSLLVVGHLHTGATGHDHGDHGGPYDHGHDDHGGQHGHEDHDHQPPAEASVTAASITERLDPAVWDVVRAGEHARTVEGGGGHDILQDVVVRAVRRGATGG